MYQLCYFINKHAFVPPFTTWLFSVANNERQVLTHVNMPRGEILKSQIPLGASGLRASCAFCSAVKIVIKLYGP